MVFNNCYIPWPAIVSCYNNLIIIKYNLSILFFINGGSILTLKWDTNNILNQQFFFFIFTSLFNFVEMFSIEHILLFTLIKIRITTMLAVFVLKVTGHGTIIQILIFQNTSSHKKPLLNYILTLKSICLFIATFCYNRLYLL